MAPKSTSKRRMTVEKRRQKHESKSSGKDKARQGETKRNRIRIAEAEAEQEALGARDAGDPGNADQAFPYFHFDQVAIAEAIVVPAVDRDALDAMVFAPGGHH